MRAGVLQHACAAALLVCGLLTCASAARAATLQEYLPAGVSYDPAIPVPASTLGYEVGEWHVRHDQLVSYLQRLAEASDRVRIEETGRTYEQRPLLLLTITSAANQARLEELRQEHVALTRPGADTGTLEDMPVVVYLGYSVHGNESSGANAALVVAYHLAAAQGAGIDSLLADSIILLDPSLNPDGLARFSHWANMHRGRNLVGDADHREHNEGWPSGRTNHYWFDLNRDWLLLQHPESRARVASFHRWKPNVLTDFHEMGSNSTFFFQPGVPSRRNPLTPERNVELTHALARHHARAFDEAGVLYYSEETFDDFYYGKGSTYPDVNGAIGILFEQASSRGHLRESDNGPFDFPFTIRNQCLTSYSTLAGALENRLELLRWQRDFHASAAEAGRANGVAGWVFGGARHRATSAQLLSVLLQHDIRVHALASEQTLDGVSFSPGDAWVVPTAQAQGRLVRALFETNTTFEDSLFYDVSTWTLPLALGVPYAATSRLPSRWQGDLAAAAPVLAGQIDLQAVPYAWAFGWNEYLAPRALQRLLQAGLRVRASTEPFAAPTSRGAVSLDRGTIVVPVALQDMDVAGVHALMKRIAREDGIDVHALTSGFTPEGVDLGSPSLRPLRPVHPAIVVGPGISSYEVGEAWHLLDQRMDVAVSLLERDELGSLDLADYTHLVFVQGSYGDLEKDTLEAIRRWVRGGGILVAQKGAVKWARDAELIDVAFLDDEEERKRKAKEDSTTAQKDQERTTATDIEAARRKRAPERRDYADHERHEYAHIISGAIFQVDLDTTHPLGYGFADRRLAVFRNSLLFMKPHENPYATVALYDDEPLLSGWASSRNLKRIPGTASVIAHRLGEGAVVLLVDNPNFRGFWYGTNKLFLNALFFGQLIDNTREID